MGAGKGGGQAERAILACLSRSSATAAGPAIPDGCRQEANAFDASRSEIGAHFAVKPTSSILPSRRSIDANGRDVEIVTKGRHDPCVGIRAVPVA